MSVEILPTALQLYKNTFGEACNRPQAYSWSSDKVAWLCVSDHTKSSELPLFDRPYIPTSLLDSILHRYTVSVPTCDLEVIYFRKDSWNYKPRILSFPCKMEATGLTDILMEARLVGSGTNCRIMSGKNSRAMACHKRCWMHYSVS